MNNEFVCLSITEHYKQSTARGEDFLFSLFGVARRDTQHSIRSDVGRLTFQIKSYETKFVLTNQRVPSFNLNKAPS